MKKCCKNVNILADDFIEDPIYEALDEKWKRPDVAKYLHGRTSSMSLQAMKRLLQDTDERDLMVSGLIRTGLSSICKYQRKRTTRRQKSNRASDQKEICSISVCLEGRCKEMLSIG